MSRSRPNRRTPGPERPESTLPMPDDARIESSAAHSTDPTSHAILSKAVDSERDTKETEALSNQGLLATARSRLNAALELLGRGSEETVTDDQLVGASVLANEASTTLKMLAERRRVSE